MTQQEWIKEFARILAERLGEPVSQFHLDCGKYWVSSIDLDDPDTPEEAVDEELSYWGD